MWFVRQGYQFWARMSQSMEDVANIRTYITKSLNWHLMTLTVVSKVIPAILNIFVNDKPISIANMNRLHLKLLTLQVI